MTSVGTALPTGVTLNDTLRRLEYSGAGAAATTTGHILQADSINSNAFSIAINSGVPAWFASMPEGTWAAVAAAGTLDAVKPGGAVNHSTILTQFCGGVVDTDRRSLVLACNGGVGNYSGNEAYELVLSDETPAWVRLNDPSTPTGGSYIPGAYGDGQPRSMYTADHLAYGGGELYLTGSPLLHPDGLSGNGIWKFNRANDPLPNWDLLATRTPGPVSGDALSLQWSFGSSAYDATTNRVYATGYGADQFYHIDCATDAVTTVTGNVNAGVGATSAISPSLRVWAHISPPGSGAGSLRVVNLTTNAITGPTLTGDLPTSLQAPGFVWHAVSGAFILWQGGAQLYKVTPGADPFAGTYTAQLVINGTGGVTPTAQPGNGTFGRFGLVPNLGGTGIDALVVVNSTTQATYVYKIPQGGVAVEAPPPPVSGEYTLATIDERYTIPFAYSPPTAPTISDEFTFTPENFAANLASLTTSGRRIIFSAGTYLYVSGDPYSAQIVIGGSDREIIFEDGAVLPHIVFQDGLTRARFLGGATRHGHSIYNMIRDFSSSTFSDIFINGINIDSDVLDPTRIYGSNDGGIFPHNFTRAAVINCQIRTRGYGSYAVDCTDLIWANNHILRPGGLSTGQCLRWTGVVNGIIVDTKNDDPVIGVPWRIHSSTRESDNIYLANNVGLGTGNAQFYSHGNGPAVGTGGLRIRRIWMYDNSFSRPIGGGAWANSMGFQNGEGGATEDTCPETCVMMRNKSYRLPWNITTNASTTPPGWTIGTGADANINAPDAPHVEFDAWTFDTWKD